MTVMRRISGDKAVLELVGRFDFQIHREFRDNYLELFKGHGIKRLELDFKGVDYIDSSGLGMLLLLRERAMDQGIEVVISRPSTLVSQLFEVANFGLLFKLL